MGVKSNVNFSDGSHEAKITLHISNETERKTTKWI